MIGCEFAKRLRGGVVCAAEFAGIVHRVNHFQRGVFGESFKAFSFSDEFFRGFGHRLVLVCHAAGVCPSALLRTDTNELPNYQSTHLLKMFAVVCKRATVGMSVAPEQKEFA